MADRRDPGIRRGKSGRQESNKEIYIVKTDEYGISALTSDKPVLVFKYRNAAVYEKMRDSVEGSNPQRPLAAISRDFLQPLFLTAITRDDQFEV